MSYAKHKLILIQNENIKRCKQGDMLWDNSDTLHRAHTDYDHVGLFTPIYLYVLSDEEIKVGDWFLLNNPDPTSSLKNVVKICNQATDEWIDFYRPTLDIKQFPRTMCKKIIITDNKYLGWTNFGINQNGVKVGNHITKGNGLIYSPDLPQPTDTFIDIFVDKYNSGNRAEYVGVEYEEGFYGERETMTFFKRIAKNRTDNTVPMMIRNTSWDRNGVYDIFRQFFDEVASNPSFDFETWFNEKV